MAEKGEDIETLYDKNEKGPDEKTKLTVEDFLTKPSGENLLKDVEQFLDKIAKIAGGGADKASEDEEALKLEKQFEEMVLQAEGEITLPDNAPPFSDFVPKAGKDLDQQEEEHNRKKQLRWQKKLEKQRTSGVRDLGESDDSDTDESSDDEVERDKKPADDNPYLSSKVNYPTLTELIFGESFNMEEEAPNYTPEKLKELLDQVLPKDGEMREEEGIPMPQDDSPINFNIGDALGPEKLKTLHEMLGLYDEKGQKRKGLFD